MGASAAVAPLYAQNMQRASSGSAGTYVGSLNRNESRSSRGEGNRTSRQSKRISVTALYMSMNASQRDLEVEDDLARGTFFLLIC